MDTNLYNDTIMGKIYTYTLFIMVIGGFWMWGANIIKLLIIFAILLAYKLLKKCISNKREYDLFSVDYEEFLDCFRAATYYTIVVAFTIKYLLQIIQIIIFVIVLCWDIVRNTLKKLGGR